MTRDDFLTELGAARREWEAALAGVPQDRMLEPALHGGWSVKDVIGHVAWSEQEMLGMIRQRAFVGSPLWELDLDARNAAVVKANRVQRFVDLGPIPPLGARRDVGSVPIPRLRGRPTAP